MINLCIWLIEWLIEQIIKIRPCKNKDENNKDKWSRYWSSIGPASSLRNLPLYTFHVIGVCLPSQSASAKHNQEKSPHAFAHLVSAMFDNHTFLLFWLKNKQTFRFSLHDSRFVCSLDLAVDHRLFNLNFPQISEVGRSDHVVNCISWNTQM